MFGNISSYSQEHINQSFAKGNINTASYAGLGGLVGSCTLSVNPNCVNISNSYSTVAINRSCASNTPQLFIAGGLLGDPGETQVNIVDSYAAGKISSQGVCSSVYTGGLVGDSDGTVSATSSYWDTQATGQASTAPGNAGTGESTAAMVDQATYTGWNFTNIWIADGVHYPILIWQEQSPINLWNTFSAASQENTFEPASPPGTVWSGIDYANANEVNWSDLLVLSKPPVWNYQTAIIGQGFVNSVNWTDLTELSTTPMNWTDLGVMSRAGIDWGSVNP